MKLNILSDLHLGFATMEPPRNDADVVILVGDTARPELAAHAEAVRCMRDFSRIRSANDAHAPFQPVDAARLFAQQSRWLARALARPFDGPTVVITHHAPSRRSIHPRYDGALLNASFVSNAEHLFDAGPVDLWVHGHTHDSFDYTLGETRVICNPRGYTRDGVCENAGFDIDFMVELTAASIEGYRQVDAA